MTQPRIVAPRLPTPLATPDGASARLPDDEGVIGHGATAFAAAGQVVTEVGTTLEAGRAGSVQVENSSGLAALGHAAIYRLATKSVQA